MATLQRTVTVQSFSPAAAWRLLKMSQPRVATRLAGEIWQLLDAVTDERITAFLEAKPRASTIYLGTADEIYGISLSIDICGRINPRFERVRAVQKSYAQRNLLWSVVGADHPLGKVERGQTPARAAA
jgi:hypothetical protein